MKFVVTDQELRRTDEDKIVSGNKEIFATFEFSEEWGKIGKLACFRHSEDEHGYTMIIYRGKCKVPWEVVRDGYFTVTVYGGEERDTRRRITTTTERVRVFQNGRSSNLRNSFIF